MTFTRRGGEPPVASGASITGDPDARVPDSAPGVGDMPSRPAPARLLLDANTADVLLGAALRDLATKFARHRWASMPPGENAPERALEQLHRDRR